MEKVYWTTKSGQKIDIDEMSVDHLRNTLKMIVRQSTKAPLTSPTTLEEADSLIGEEEDYWDIYQKQEW